MYPHEIDRDLLLASLFRNLRIEANLKQGALAKRAGLKQPTVSGVENPSPGHRTSRETLAKLIARGLQLPYDQVNALMWLYDGEPLSADESSWYLKGTTAANYEASYFKLRTEILACVRRILDRKKQPYAATVRIFFNADEEARLKEQETLLELEEGPGIRLLVTKFPSSLTHPSTAFDTGELTHQNVTSKDGRGEYQRIHKRRGEVFLHNVHVYGERSIHSKTDLESYLQDENAHRFSLPQRRRQVENWIELLRHHPLYEVGLAHTTPLLELGVKNSTPVAVMRGAPRDREHTRASIHGLHHVFWHDEFSVLHFLLDFERLWDDIAPEDRDKERVIHWLRELLTKA
jgi:transcriptional regulator with XRE-family HTH domain